MCDTQLTHAHNTSWRIVMEAEARNNQGLHMHKKHTLLTASGNVINSVVGIAFSLSFDYLAEGSDGVPGVDWDNGAGSVTKVKEWQKLK